MTPGHPAARVIITMFTNNFTPHVSGVATAVTRISHALERRGHAVHIFAPWTPGYRDTLPTIHRVPSFPFPEPFIPAPLPLRGFLQRRVARLRPDILHTHHPYLIGPSARSVARALGRPIVFTYHSMYEEYTHYVPLVPRAWIRHLAIVSSLSFAQSMDAVIAPTSSVTEILRSRGLRTRLSVIPTGVDTTRFEQHADVRETTRASWGFRPDEIAIVTFGRLSREKQFGLLVEAFARLCRRVPTLPVRLIIGGKGRMEPELQHVANTMGIASRVLFVGHLPPETVPSFLAGGDIFAYASTTETQGLVTLEAMTAGLPAVVVDAPGNRDLVQHDVSGLLTTPTADDLARALALVVRAPDLRERLGRGARRRALEFSEDAVAVRVEALYESLRS